MQLQFAADRLVSGEASGDLLFSHVSLSFWGGINQNTGQVVDHHHPLCGQSVKGRVLAIPSGRGSCTGSGVLLELLLNGQGPAALIFQQQELILTLGVLIAKTLFGVSIPVAVVSPTAFAALSGYKTVTITKDAVVASNTSMLPYSPVLQIAQISRSVITSQRDNEMLQGLHGPALQSAMEILVNVAQIQGAEGLLDITQAHIDACIYIGPACLQFAQRLASMGGKFAVPTTLNSISLDYRRWKELGIDKAVADPARALADAYMAMGARMSFTCAPYLLDTAPKRGEQIGWGESNAITFANSVLGAKTQKYPDFLDVCIALTGRAPLSGCHIDINRQPKLAIRLPKIKNHDDSSWPVIGYAIGQLSGGDIPFIYGLEDTNPRTADLKAFSAAFATTGSAPMFHINGITPESAEVESIAATLQPISITVEDLRTCNAQLNTATDPSVDLVSLGNPHFAVEEFADLAALCTMHTRQQQRRHPGVRVVVTTSRAVQEKAAAAGYLETISQFGVEVITDTCWCMIDEPVIPPAARNLMTNSGKYAHYAPGMVKRGVHFGSLAQCVEAACTGEFRVVTPSWLSDEV